MRIEPLAPLLAALWSAAMLASFLGWGSVANRWLAPGRRVDWGLRAGWGMAVFILTGGFLCAAQIALCAPVLIAQVGLGVGALYAVRSATAPAALSRGATCDAAREVAREDGREVGTRCSPWRRPPTRSGC